MDIDTLFLMRCGFYVSLILSASYLYKIKKDIADIKIISDLNKERHRIHRFYR